MNEETVAAAYDARVAEYIALMGTLPQMADADREAIAAWCEVTGGVLLDAGCGPGHWSAFLAAGGREVVGIDISEQFLASARFRFPGVRFERASVRELPFADDSLGGILAWYSLIHLAPYEVPAVLSEFSRVLAPGGSLLIGYFRGERVEAFPHAVHPAHLWSEAALSASLEAAGFAVVERASRGRGPSEQGTRPHGALRARLL